MRIEPMSKRKIDSTKPLPAIQIICVIELLSGNSTVRDWERPTQLQRKGYILLTSLLHLQAAADKSSSKLQEFSHSV